MSTGLRETLQRIIGKRQVSLSLLGHFERIERELDVGRDEIEPIEDRANHG
jgi:hypothetical protein